MNNKVNSPVPANSLDDDGSAKANPSNLFDQLRKQQAAPDQASADALPIDQASLVPGADASNEATELSSGSGMPPAAKRALVSLLRHGVMLANQKVKLFESLCRYQILIRQHLADVYLMLVLDEPAGVAYIAGLNDETEAADEDGTEPVSLLIRRTLSLFDTLLLLILRKHYQERESSGAQRVVIDVERIEANLTPFIPLTNSAKADRRTLVAALKKMLEKKILARIRGSNDRFEITPIIRYVVNAEFLEKMLQEYLLLARQHDVNLTPELEALAVKDDPGKGNIDE